MDKAEKINKAYSEPEGSVFQRINYIWMLAGILIIILGFILMIGGGSDDPNVFNADKLYGFQRITLAPILVILGFAIEIVAIFKKPA